MITDLSCKEACIILWSYEPCHAGPPKTDRSHGRVLTKYGPLEEGMANHFSILAVRTPWTVWKSKRYDTRRWAPKLEGIQHATGKSRGQLLTAPERVKRLGQSGNDTQLWICLVVKVWPWSTKWSRAKANKSFAKTKQWS